MSRTIPFFDELPGIAERLARTKVLYTDLDGTLLGRGACLLCDGEGTPTLDAATAVSEVNAAGLPVVITSGRNSKQLMEVSRMLGWRDFIAELGCVRAYDRFSRVVYETGDWPRDALPPGQTPYEAIKEMCAVEMLEEAFPGLIEYHDPWHRDREVTHVLRGNLPVPQAQTLLDTLPLPIDLIDNGIIHPPKHHLTVEEIHAYHLVPRGASKQRGIAADLHERGLTPEDAIAIGDSAADVDMAESVGLVVIVNNGLDDPVLVERASGAPFVAATRRPYGSGWREFAEAWLTARSAPED